MTGVGGNDPCPWGSGKKFTAERDRREGRPAYDFTWMWTELGLERPG